MSTAYQNYSLKQSFQVCKNRESFVQIKISSMKGWDARSFIA